VGILGCGGATQIMYAPILRYVERCAVTALCDPSAAATDRVQALLQRDLDTYHDVDEFLRHAPVDAVIVASPVFLHREHVVKAARAGKHVLCEKPMARTIAECDEMIAACATAHVTLMIAFMKRFDKSTAYAKELIDAGRLGTPYELLCDWHAGQPIESVSTTPSQNWRASLATWGGAYQDFGAHTTDLSRWWLGEITAVSGEVAILGPNWEVENSATGLYLHAGGQRSVHHLGLSARGTSELYRIEGSRASLEIQYGPPMSYISTDPFRMTLTTDGGRHQEDVTRYNQDVLDLEQAANARYKRELDHFRDSIFTGTPPMTTGEDGRKATEAINAVYLSAYTGEKVHLPLRELPELERIFRELKARSPRVR
jgi:predicted dehydrogenase